MPVLESVVISVHSVCRNVVGVLSSCACVFFFFFFRFFSSEKAETARTRSSVEKGWSVGGPLPPDPSLLCPSNLKGASICVFHC